MALLYWHSHILYLPGATRTLVTHKNNLHGTLITHGYQNMRINNLEVAGGKDECWFSVGHFLIDPNTPGGTEARGTGNLALFLCSFDCRNTTSST